MIRRLRSMVLLSEDEYERLLDLASVNEQYNKHSPPPPPPAEETNKKESNIQTTVPVSKKRKKSKPTVITQTKMDVLDTIKENDSVVDISSESEKKYVNDAQNKTSAEDVEFLKKQKKKFKTWLKKK